jgi:hypothetical protein
VHDLHTILNQTTKALGGSSFKVFSLSKPIIISKPLPTRSIAHHSTQPNLLQTASFIQKNISLGPSNITQNIQNNSPNPASSHIPPELSKQNQHTAAYPIDKTLLNRLSNKPNRNYNLEHQRHLKISPLSIKPEKICTHPPKMNPIH